MAVLVGLPVYLVRRLQSVLNAAARLIYHMTSANHITDALVCLHWLRVPQRIEYKIAVLTYKALHRSAPRYLGPLVPVADLPGRRAQRSAGTSRVSVPSVRLSTVGSRAFPVAGPRNIERSATGDDVSPVAVFVPSASEVAPLQTIVSRPRLLVFLLSDCLC